VMTAVVQRPTARLVAAAVVAVTAAGCGGQSAPRASPDNPAGVVISNVTGQGQFNGAEPARPYTMPDITLTATDNRPFNLVSDTSSPVTLVFFGYIHCPDVCPLVMSDLAYTVLHLPADVRDQTQVVFITTDPGRDSPAALRSYLDRYDPDFVGLTGDLRDIVAVAHDMGVPIEGRHTLPGGGYGVGHGAQVIGFKGDSAPVIWTAGTPTDDMISDVTELAGS